ncbi:glycosyltransferase family 4 protein [Myxococcota bacterium]|nr:glycosyltransferase family 4 protein [Myxococcota bacterium]
MRVGIVTEYYRPWPGGISEHVHHEACELRERGHRVWILTGPGDMQETGSDNVPPEPDQDVIRLRAALKFTSNGAASRMVMGRELLKLRGVLRRLELDAVHIHAPMDPILGWATLAASETATVGTFHANFSPSPLWNTLYRGLGFISKRLFQRMDGRIAVSPEAERSISHYFPAHYEIIPNGVDVARFHPDLPSTAPLDDGRPNVLFVGRPDPRKGLPLLLEAFLSVRQKIPGARLVVVGVSKHQLTGRLGQLAQRLGDDLLLAGYVSAGELPRYYSGCQVFCSPATGQESQGIVLLEAMAAGRPALAFSIPGYRDVVSHGRDGWLIDEIGSTSLAENLCELLADANLREQLGQAGRKKALSFAWPAVAERIEKELEAARERHALRLQ